ncbi:MAG TPA: hypothetical protein VKE74_11075, partial [Gemmataceae bacterium]|nr:hypothetical protein [Gemmataceae bacterium]
MSLTWITSPQTGDIVGLSLSVTVQWNITREDKKPGPTSKSKAAAKAATVDPKIKLSASGTGISVTVDGNANSAEYSIGTDTSRTFTVICSDVPSSGDVTLTAELYDTTPAVVASDTESPTVQALLDLGGGFSHGLGGFAPLAKSAGG